MNDVAKKAHRGILILVLGIVGIAACGPIGIAAWVMGSSDLKEMDAGRMDDEGRDLTQAGKIIGIISVILMIISCGCIGLVFIGPPTGY